MALDADILTRAAAFDHDGRQIDWTPEAVGFRLVESYRLLDRTPMRIGPKPVGSCWPQITTTWEDLVDEQTKQRLLVAYEGEVNWKEWVEKYEPKTVSDMSRDRRDAMARKADVKDLNAADYSRAEEAIRWCALYLQDKPLKADAVSLWALCRGAKRSLEAILQWRRNMADAIAMGLHVHARTPVPYASRQEVMPGRNFIREMVYRQRPQACASICDALVAARVLFRESDPDLDSRNDRSSGDE